MSVKTPLTQTLGLDHPILQAPMGGANLTPPALVSAVSNAGALGFMGASAMSPAQITTESRAVRERTSRPFGINLFAPTPTAPLPADVSDTLAVLAPYYAEVGLPAPPLTAAAFTFDEQLAAALESGAAVFSFTFALLPAAAMDALRARGMYIVGTATTVDEAVALERSGVDAVVAQGSEAGGHRGTFATSFENAMIGTMALVPQVVDAIRIPVIASGGIMDGRGIAAALALGASAVQMGTAFLACDECGIAPAYRQALLAAHEDATHVTRVFSGRPARGIVNRFMSEMEDPHCTGAILPFPYQNALTRSLRNAAAQQGRPEFLSLWAGQGVRLARRMPAADLVRILADETARAIGRLQSSQS